MKALSLATCAAAAIVLVGTIDVTSSDGTSTTTVREVEVPMAPLASGSSGGLNGTAGTATVTGTILSTTTNVLYLNNTDASHVWFARIDVASSTGVANLPTLTIGINNGTSSVPQAIAALGVLTQTTGTYVRLEPSSTDRIYVTDAVTTLGLTSTFTLTVRAAIDTSETSYVDTGLTITIH